MMRRVRDLGVPAKLHTNGTRPDVVETLLREELIDCLALDCKAPLDERFFKAAGITQDSAVLESVKRSFALAAAMDGEREYHTTLAPAVLDFAAFGDMATALETGGTWYLQQYENGDCLNPRAAGSRQYTNDELDRLEALARSRHDRVVLKRGRNA